MAIDSPYNQGNNTDEVIANEGKDLTALQSLIPQQGEPSPQINTSNISAQQFLSPNEIEAYNQFKEQQPQNFTGALPLNQYYPDANHNIAVGNSSGSIIGSHTIYAPGGGLIPLGMMDARDAAVQKAALQKAKEVEDFRSQFRKGPELSKLTNINQNLTNEYFKFHGEAWSSALKKAGGDPNKAKDMLQNNPDFLAKDKSFQVLAKIGNAVVDKLATLQHSLDTGNYIASPALKEAMDKVKNTMNPDSPDFRYLSNAVMRLDADREFSDASNEALARVVSSKTGKDYDLSNAESYKTFKEDLEFVDEGAKQAVKDNLNKIYANSSLYSPEYINKNVDGMLGWTKKNEDIKVSAKPKDDEPSLTPANTNEANVINGAVIQNTTPSTPMIDPKTGKQKVDSKGNPMFNAPEENYREGKYSVYDQATFDKPFKTVIPLSALGTNIKKGALQTAQGNVEVQIGTVGNALVYHGLTGENAKYNDLMVDDEVTKKFPNLKNHTKYAPVVPIQYKAKNENGVEVEESTWQPLKTVENALRGKGGKNDKALADLKAKAEGRTTTHKADAPKQKETASTGEFKTKSGIKFTVK